MPYALVTGASKGIGKEIVYELCRRKINVLLVARSENLLSELKDEVEKKFNIKASYFAADLSKANAATGVFEWTKKNNYTVNILVNNAGYGLSGPFEKYNLSEQQAMMHVNMDTLVALTLLFLPQLKNHAQSYILNIASTAAYQAVPFLSLYSATKSFVLNFSRGLSFELKKTNVSVTCLCPGGTNTDFGNRAQISIKAMKAGEKVNMEASDVAAIGVKGMFKKKTEVIAGALNKLGAVMVGLSPKSLTETFAANLYKY